MRAVTSGLSTGGGLALAYKVLSLVDKPPASPTDLCDLVGHQHGSFSWSSFCLGIACGIVIYAFVELCVTLKWAFVQWVAELRARGAEVSSKQTYRILT